MVLWEQVEAAELDEMWSFVQKKANQRWLWLAIGRKTRAVLAYAFGRRKDSVFRKLKALLSPLGICMFYTDDWGSYGRNLAPADRKANTQALERRGIFLRHLAFPHFSAARLCNSCVRWGNCIPKA